MKQRPVGTCVECRTENVKLPARNLCQSCYHRLRRYGNPGFKKYKQDPVECYVRGCPYRGATQGMNPGMCRGHTVQQQRGTPLRTLKPSHRDESGMKQCRTCGNWSPGDEEWPRESCCRRCGRGAYLQKSHNITLDQWDEMLESQGGGCSICGSEQQLVVDHSHSCCPPSGRGGSCGDCVRSLLCNRCNVAVGYLETTPELVSKWLSYIETK